MKKYKFNDFVNIINENDSSSNYQQYPKVSQITSITRERYGETVKDLLIPGIDVPVSQYFGDGEGNGILETKDFGNLMLIFLSNHLLTEAYGVIILDKNTHQIYPKEFTREMVFLPDLDIKKEYILLKTNCVDLDNKKYISYNDYMKLNYSFNAKCAMLKNGQLIGNKWFDYIRETDKANIFGVEYDDERGETVTNLLTLDGRFLFKTPPVDLDVDGIDENNIVSCEIKRGDYALFKFNGQEMIPLSKDDYVDIDHFELRAMTVDKSSESVEEYSRIYYACKLSQYAYSTSFDVFDNEGKQIISGVCVDDEIDNNGRSLVRTISDGASRIIGFLGPNGIQYGPSFNISCERLFATNTPDEPLCVFSVKRDSGYELFDTQTVMPIEDEIENVTDLTFDEIKVINPIHKDELNCLVAVKIGGKCNVVVCPICDERWDKSYSFLCNDDYKKRYIDVMFLFDDWFDSLHYTTNNSVGVDGYLYVKKGNDSFVYWDDGKLYPCEIGNTIAISTDVYAIVNKTYCNLITNKTRFIDYDNSLFSKNWFDSFDVLNDEYVVVESKNKFTVISVDNFDFLFKTTKGSYSYRTEDKDIEMDDAVWFDAINGVEEGGRFGEYLFNVVRDGENVWIDDCGESVDRKS